jgi:hypothetical protein
VILNRQLPLVHVVEIILLVMRYLLLCRE